MKKNRYPWKDPLSHEKCCDYSVKIRVKDLNVFYGKKQILSNINMQINEGCISGIIGPSGCGKSSFIQSFNRINELISNSKVIGDIFINGKSVFDVRVDLIELRKKVGIIFQEPTPLPLSIEQNISISLKEHGFDNIKDRVVKSLKDVGLFNEIKENLKMPANNLSGGQKQRLCIARTIALGPEIILMDEPCSSLDPISSDKIEELIDNLRGKYTIIIITHNLPQARRLCDFVHAFWYDYKTHSGKLIESGTCIDIFENPKDPILQDYIRGLKG